MKIYYLLTNTYVHNIYKYIHIKLNRLLICSFCDSVHYCKHLFCGFSRLLKSHLRRISRRDQMIEVTERLILHVYNRTKI